MDLSQPDVDVVNDLDVRWRRELLEWAIPTRVTDQFEVEPFQLDPTVFQPPSQWASDLRTDLIGVFAGESESILDVGAGAGASLVAIQALFGSVVVVEQSRAMVEAVTENLAGWRGSESFKVFAGSFLEISHSVPRCSVVNSSNMIYNVLELSSYLRELDRLAVHLVSLELTPRHPYYPSNRAFTEFWGLTRPTTPTAIDVFEMAQCLGFEPQMQSFTSGMKRPLVRSAEEQLRRRLGLGPNRTAAVRDFIERNPTQPSSSCLIWWTPKSRKL